MRTHPAPRGERVQTSERFTPVTEQRYRAIAKQSR